MGISYNPQVVTNGLVFYLDAANARSYPGTGTTWSDLTGNGAATLIGAGVAYNSANGGVMNFTDNGSYGDTGKAAANFGFRDASYSCDAFVYPTNLSGDRPVFGTTQTGLQLGFHLIFRDGMIYQGHYSADYYVGSVTVNTWNHIAWTYERTTKAATIYKNGVKLGSGIIEPFLGTSSILIAHAFGGNFLGSANGYKIYNRALSDGEVIQNFAAARGRYGI